MKKLLLILVSLLTCLSFCALSEGDTYYCGHYRYVLLPDGTAKITDYRGAGYTAADCILQIPEKLDNHPVSAIGDLAFHRCLFHEHIIIPDSVTAIGTFSFADCPALTEMTIPDSIETMAINPFAFCQNLTKFNVSMENPYFYVIDDVLFNKAEKELISYPYALSASSYVIPGETLAIGASAFHSCRALTEITIPNSVIEIGESAFRGCESLSKISLPDSVISIGDGAFADCGSLKEVIIPKSVFSIGTDVFRHCNKNLVLTVDMDSYAEQWAIENDFAYQFPNSLDWLNS